MPTARPLLLLPLLSLASACSLTTGFYQSLTKGSGPALVNLQTVRQTVQSGVPGAKTGRACSKNALGIVAWGDNSVAAAKRDGGVARVATIDADITNFLGVYAQSCTIVTGAETDTDAAAPVVGSHQDAPATGAGAGAAADDEDDEEAAVNRVCDGNTLVGMQQGAPAKRFDCAQVFSQCEGTPGKATCHLYNCTDAAAHVYDTCHQTISGAADKGAFVAACEQKKFYGKLTACQLNCFVKASCDLNAIRDCSSGKACKGH